jgi:pimeloyl-ACP methyl ester carboxylesterase
MRKIIAALQTSVDGFIEGPNGELDWAMAEDEETWRDIFEMLESVKNPPLVLLHGGGSTIDTTFGKVLPSLAKSRQVVAFEQQDHGPAIWPTARLASSSRRVTPWRSWITSR